MCPLGGESNFSSASSFSAWICCPTYLDANWTSTNMFGSHEWFRYSKSLQSSMWWFRLTCIVDHRFGPGLIPSIEHKVSPALNDRWARRHELWKPSCQSIRTSSGWLFFGSYLFWQSSIVPLASMVMFSKTNLKNSGWMHEISTHFEKNFKTLLCSWIDRTERKMHSERTKACVCATKKWRKDHHRVGYQQTPRSRTFLVTRH